MATLVDLTNQMEAFGAAVSSASDQTSKLLRTTGELVEVGPFAGQGPGRLSLTPLQVSQPTIGFGRGESLLGGFQPGINVGPTFLNYASTFLGFGASGYEETTTRAGVRGG